MESERRLKHKPRVINPNRLGLTLNTMCVPTHARIGHVTFLSMQFRSASPSCRCAALLRRSRCHSVVRFFTLVPQQSTVKLKMIYKRENRDILCGGLIKSICFWTGFSVARLSGQVTSFLQSNHHEWRFNRNEVHLSTPHYGCTAEQKKHHILPIE